MGDKLLPMNMQRSCCSQWCWAAVTATITTGLALTDQASTQVAVFEVLNPDAGIDCSGCCVDNCANAACDRTGDIGTVLARVNLNFGGAQLLSGISFRDICAEIDKGRPVVAVIKYLDVLDHLHFLLIFGYVGADSLTIGDPVDGSTFTASFTAYSNAGAYTDPSQSSSRGSWESVYFLDAL